MKRDERRGASQRNPTGQLNKAELPAALAYAVSLRQVHPMPRSRRGIVSVAAHLARRFAAQRGREVPGLSKDAALFLGSRFWAFEDLARRVWRAVATNRGSLITASDLSDYWDLRKQKEKQSADLADNADENQASSRARNQDLRPSASSADDSFCKDQ